MNTGLATPPFPSDDDIPILADWVELATMGGQHPLTRGKLRTTMGRESVGAADRRTDETWLELTRRAKIQAKGWPLKLDGDTLSVARSDSALIFHYFLCAVSLGQNIDNAGRQLFEHCVSDVTAGLTLNHALRIGFPRTGGMPHSFREAVSLYCRLSGESVVAPPPGTDNDLGLDVASWRLFSDGRGGYLHFVGQCATGADWFEKLGDLDIRVWSDHVNWAVTPVRFFATPFVIPIERWRRSCLKGGLVLDRPRLLELATTSPLRPRRLAAILDYCRLLYH